MMPTAVLVCVIVSIVLALISIILSVVLIFTLKRGGGRTLVSVGGSHQRKNFIDRFGTMNLILVLVGVALLVFTIAMIVLFKQQYAIPDTLCTCVFAALGGECGVLGWIKTTKERNKQREWELEDRKRQTRSPSTDDGLPKG